MLAWEVAFDPPRGRSDHSWRRAARIDPMVALRHE